LAFTGTAASPACQAPYITSKYSGPFFITRATRSPGASPRARKPPAMLATRAANVR
jgi:hypothetical protein